MSFGQLTKQLAKQAIDSQVKEVVDSLRPADAAATAESIPSAKGSAPGTGDNIGAVIIAQIAAMQKSLKEDQELVVLCTTPLESLRVLEIYAPSWRVFVLTGIDSNKQITRIISPVDALQLTCKPMALQTGAKPANVRLIAPKPD